MIVNAVEFEQMHRDGRWPDFRMHELQCHCDQGQDAREAGCEILLVDTRLMDILQALRTIVNVPVLISCGYRCTEHNAAVGGKEEHPGKPGSGSQHLYGRAADIQKPGLPAGFGQALDILVGDQGGVGEYSWGWHVDVRGFRARWVQG